MMLFGLYAMDGAPPFRTVLLHGLVRDAHGKKMSKSRGNVVDPLVWMDAYGADATRFSLLQGANPGADEAINEEWVRGARNFCNKLWNATRFALLNGATTDGPVPGRRRAAPTPGSSAGCRPSSPRSTSSTSTTSSPRSPTCSTTSRGTRSATGTWSWRRSSLADDVDGAAPPGGCSVRCSRRCCGCCTR